MKYLIFVFLVTLLSCSDETTYNDPSGTWEFSKGNISGTVKIVKMNSTTFSSLDGTKFSIAGTEYTNEAFTTFHLDSEMRVFSISDGAHLIVFGEGTFNDSFTKMNYAHANWRSNCDIEGCEAQGYEADILFRRK